MTIRGALIMVGCALGLATLGCGGGPGEADTGGTPRRDTGPGYDGGPGWDGGPTVDSGMMMMGGTCTRTVDCTPPLVCYMGTCIMGGRLDGGPGMDGGCVPAFEICGDHIDQNCDGHDESCGDNDHDNFQACRPPAASIDWATCDCDDTDPGTYPASGTISGGAELCDGKDNDCDFVIDESPSCCTSCHSLASVNQADICHFGPPDGTCGCSTNTAGGGAPCPTGQSCCSSGCVDTSTSLANCGFCGAMCTINADTCSGGQCHCGTASVCQFTLMCTAGACH